MAIISLAFEAKTFRAQPRNQSSIFEAGISLDVFRPGCGGGHSDTGAAEEITASDTMTTLEIKLDDVCRYITKAKGRCLFCGSTRDIEVHHIFGGRWKSVWFFRWMLIFLIPLCKECHSLAHLNKTGFWIKLEVALEGEPERLSAILHYRESKVAISEKPDLKILYEDLRKQAAMIEETNYMDSPDEVYRGRDENNQPIF